MCLILQFRILFVNMLTKQIRKQKLNSHIEITPLNLLNSDERGETYDYNIRENGDYILITRKAGSISGNTYHKGASPATNPKTFVLISGEIELGYRHIEEKTHQTIQITQPSIIKIKPLVTHSIKALTDMIILECNSIADIQNDRFREQVEI